MVWKTGRETDPQTEDEQEVEMDREIIGIIVTSYVAIAGWEIGRWLTRYLLRRSKRD
jgi:hypothetical protein